MVEKNGHILSYNCLQIILDYRKNKPHKIGIIFAETVMWVCLKMIKITYDCVAMSLNTIQS